MPSSTPDVEVALRNATEHWGRLVALLIGQFNRIDLAEDAVQEAYVAAARTWPARGVPTNATAWLLTAARRKVVDTLRAEAIAARKLPLLVVDQHPAAAPSGSIGEPLVIADDRLRLIFMCCHPAIPPGSSAALTLRLVAGLKVSEIARLFLVSETTMAARITRAKRKIVEAGIPFAVPPPTRLAERLDAVLAVIYLVFTEGYVATEGTALVRTDLCDEAIRLGADARRTRRRPAGDRCPAGLAGAPAFPAFEQGWRRRQARAARRPGSPDRGTTARSPRACACSTRRSVIGRPTPLASDWRRSIGWRRLIAAAHATSPSPSATDWRAIAGLYAELEELTGSPVVRINRAVAVAETDGPAAALALLDGLDDVLERQQGPRRRARRAARPPGSTRRVGERLRRRRSPWRPMRPSGRISSAAAWRSTTPG